MKNNTLISKSFYYSRIIWIPPGQRSIMACADVDMDIQRTDEEPHRADSGEPTMVRRYQATEVLPDDKGPLHDLLQKQPSVLGVRYKMQTLVKCNRM